jgi:hypothetical protein
MINGGQVVSLSAWLVSAILMLPIFLYATTITRPVPAPGQRVECISILYPLSSSLQPLATSL